MICKSLTCVGLCTMPAMRRAACAPRGATRRVTRIRQGCPRFVPWIDIRAAVSRLYFDTASHLRHEIFEAVHPCAPTPSTFRRHGVALNGPVPACVVSRSSLARFDPREP